MTRCHFRTHRECGCPVGSCRVQPATPAPVVSFSWRNHAAAITFGIVMALICAGTMHALQKQETIFQQQARV